MGPPDAPVRFKLLDATERVLMREGYPAVTSRNVGLEAGVDQKLVYYYFRTIEELVVATFKRRSEDFLTNLEDIAKSSTPVRDLWALSTDKSGRLIIAFMGMASRNAALLEEVARYKARANEIIEGIFSRCLSRTQLDHNVITPRFLNFVVASMALSLIVEGGLGLLDTEQDIQKSIEHCLHILEG